MMNISAFTPALTYTAQRQQATGNRQQATGNRQQATGNSNVRFGQQATTLDISNFTPEKKQWILWQFLSDGHYIEKVNLNAVESIEVVGPDGALGYLVRDDHMNEVYRKHGHPNLTEDQTRVIVYKKRLGGWDRSFGTDLDGTDLDLRSGERMSWGEAKNQYVISEGFLSSQRFDLDDLRKWFSEYKPA